MGKLQVVITGLILLFLIDVSTAQQVAVSDNDFFNDYTLPFYNGRGQWDQLRDTAFVNTNGNYAYTASVNTTGFQNHIAFDITALADMRLTGTVQLSSGETVNLNVNAYTSGLTSDNHLDFTLSGVYGSATNGNFHASYYLGYTKPALHCDICLNYSNPSEKFLSVVYGNPDDWSDLGLDTFPGNTKGVAYPIGQGVYITGLSLTHVSGGNYTVKISEYSTSELSQAMAGASDPTGGMSSYPGITDILSILNTVPGAIVSLLGMVVTLLGFALWVIYPTHLLLIIVSAESLIVLIALTSSRDIFTAISKFARYNEQAFYAIQGVAGVTINVLTEAAVFAYNVFQLVNPFRWIFG